jgi:hypothetical protein
VELLGAQVRDAGVDAGTLFEGLVQGALAAGVADAFVEAGDGLQEARGFVEIALRVFGEAEEVGFGGAGEVGGVGEGFPKVGKGAVEVFRLSERAFPLGKEGDAAAEFGGVGFGESKAGAEGVATGGGFGVALFEAAEGGFGFAEGLAAAAFGVEAEGAVADEAGGIGERCGGRAGNPGLEFVVEGGEGFGFAVARGI